MPTIRELVIKAKRFYPTSRAMRKQWVRHTLNLHQTGQHALITGGWQAGTRSQVLTTRLVG
jgi:hypothetical protein